MHKKVICRNCFDVISQCRCFDHTKMIQYELCTACTKEAIKPQRIVPTETLSDSAGE